MVIVYGTICVDRIRRITDMPKKGGYCPVFDQIELLGGEAANTACYLTMWRQEVALVGNTIGSGFEGEQLRLMLLEKGLDVHLLSRQGETPVCDVYVTDDGDRTMFGFGFHNEDFCTGRASIPVRKGAWFTADPNIADASREAIAGAYAAGMHLYLMDFFREDERIPEGSFCQYGTDWVGERHNDSVNLKWVTDWTAKHNCSTILTDAGQGCYVCEPGEAAIHLPAYPVEVTKDTTGAGDAFRAGTLYGLSHRWSLGHSLRFGAAAAALKVPHLGATEHIPTIHDVKDYIQQFPSVSKAYDF